MSGRKLSAVMFTDIVGYTSLTQSDEANSLLVLQRHNKLLRPLFTKYNGKEVKTIGDSFLVEFESALEAVNCAIEIQESLHDYNLSTRDEWKIKLRIGIHIGDVIHKDADIFGDAVNIASRIQPLAEPEGICISDQVFGQVRNKVSLTLEKLAPRELKNIQFHIDVYKLVMPWEKESKDSNQRLDTRRIAVLPFSNMSPDPNDEFFADGLTEELIDRLCQVKELEVIARTSVMGYKKKESRAGEIGRELKAGALVEGSVRKAGNKIRVTAQLIDSNNEAHLWSSRYDRDLQDVFAVQTDIAEQVASALRIQLVQSEKKAIREKPTDNIEAYTLYLRGRFLWNKRTLPALNEALKLFHSAVEKDPKYARAFTGISDCYSILIDRLHNPWEEAGPKARAAAEKALELDPDLPEAHASMGLVLNQALEFDSAEAEFNKAIELNPAYASAYHWYAVMLVMEGRMQEADRFIAQAENSDPLSASILSFSGNVAWINGRSEEALYKWNRSLEINPDFHLSRFRIAEYYAKNNMKQKAVDELKRIESAPTDTEAEAKILTTLLIFHYGNIGEKDEAQRLFQKLVSIDETTPKPPIFMALAYAGLDNKEKFFEYLLKGSEDRSSSVALLISSSFFEKIRLDPRFDEYLTKRKLSARFGQARTN